MEVEGLQQFCTRPLSGDSRISEIVLREPWDILEFAGENPGSMPLVLHELWRTGRIQTLQGVYGLIKEKMEDPINYEGQDETLTDEEKCIVLSGILEFIYDTAVLMIDRGDFIGYACNFYFANTSSISIVFKEYLENLEDLNNSSTDWYGEVGSS